MNRVSRLGATRVLVSIGIMVCGIGAASEAPQIKIDDAWARSLPQAAKSSEFYMVIRNTGAEPDKLVTAQSPACEVVELYEYHQSAHGAIGMRPVGAGFIDVPAGGRVELKAGGLHLMCMNRKGDFRPGARVPVTLRFQRSGEITAQLTVRAP